LLVNGIKTSAYVSLDLTSSTTTTGGNLVIGNINNGNGIGKTLDTNLSFHFIQHMALSPIRMVCGGISSRFCDTDQINDETGYPPFVEFWFQLVHMFQNQSMLVQAFLLMAFACLVGPLYAMETVLDVVVDLVGGGPAWVKVVAALGLVLVIRAARTSSCSFPFQNSTKNKVV
jgi:hypothetical protein